MESSVEHNKGPVRAMIVDDDATTVALLERQLRDSGYAVRTAPDGPSALRLMKEWRPQVVILDWVMPGMDGPSVCRQIRLATAPGRYTYVIMVTVHVEKQRVVEAFEAGVDDFLSKPVDGGELIARLHAADRTIRLQTELSRRERRARRLSLRMERLNQELRQLAMTDELTGLMNRREANRRLSHTWALAERYGHPLACAVLDVDHFKCLNDTRGHQAGDAVLKVVADAIARNLRATDSASRYGGDEFLLIFPHQTIEEATAAAERIRVAIAGDPSSVRAGASVSVGVAAREEGMLTFHDLVDHADRALYHAKRAGKNRTVAGGAVQGALLV